MNRIDLLETAQRLLVKEIAKSSEGVGLALVGGLRYRLLRDSGRLSNDIDYSFCEDLQQKRNSLFKFLQSRVAPMLSRQTQMPAEVYIPKGPDYDSDWFQTLIVAFYRTDFRLEIPIDLLNLPKLDPIQIISLDGTLVPTFSEQDAIEAKIIAVLSRVPLQYRDLLDLFLFKGHISPDTPRRLKRKLSIMKIVSSLCQNRIKDLAENKTFHANGIKNVMSTQMDPTQAKVLEAAGGAHLVMNECLGILLENFASP